MIVKVPETVAPGGTVTEAGTEASVGFVLVRLKISPPVGAGLASTIVLEPKTVPPVIVAADKLTVTAIGFTFRMLDAVNPLTVAVIVTGVLFDTAVVVMVNAEDTVCPAATGTVAGTAATAGFELVRLTVHPPAGAALLNTVTFDAAGFPPITALDESEMEAAKVTPVPPKLTVRGAPGALL